MAAYVAFAKLPKVPVEPRADVLQSSIPAICKSFLGTGADTIPVPLGAGMSLTQMEPHLPVTLVGTVWGLPILLPQKPRRTGMMDNLAMMIAPRIAVATSLEHLTPIPTKALKRVRCPDGSVFAQA